ncbi:tetratricopeptide repeat protein [Fodinicola feengrottensis]|uniref:tetratricopeptide repeat protein n=1 Tax=Fodinicola feengrottensis TaxID=435914 RepID=UPI0013D1EADC|nr:tetratricopeptide repeat protein [Fodinicola feengrottensis]
MTSDLATVLVVDRARTAAYAGDLDEAERILATLAPDATDEALDLRARVYAQRGDFAEADAWWARIPESPGAVAGRPLIAAIKGRRRTRRPLWQPGRIAGVAAVTVAALATGVVVWVHSEPPPPADPAVAAAQVAEQRARALEQQAAAAQARQAVTASSRAKALDQLATAMTVPGVHVRRQADSVEVLFDAGVFSYDDNLTTGGAIMLDRIGTRLRGQTASITVVGHAVLGGPQSGGLSGRAGPRPGRRSPTRARERPSAERFRAVQRRPNRQPLPHPAAQPPTVRSPCS